MVSHKRQSDFVNPDWFRLMELVGADQIVYVFRHQSNYTGWRAENSRKSVTHFPELLSRKSDISDRPSIQKACLQGR